MALPGRQREGFEAASVQGPQGAGWGGDWETVYALQMFPPQPLEAGAPLTSPRAKASGWAHHHKIYHHKEATAFRDLKAAREMPDPQSQQQDSDPFYVLEQRTPLCHPPQTCSGTLASLVDEGAGLKLC